MISRFQHNDDRHPIEDWDPVFEDTEPTKTLTTSGEESTTHVDQGARAPDYQLHQQTLSATRLRRHAPSTSDTPGASPMTAPIPHQQPRRDAALGPRAGSADSLQSAVYRRVQFIPSSSGALVAYGLSTGLFALVEAVFRILGLTTYTSFTGATLAVSSASTQGQALPWVVASTLIWLSSFGWAGYTAARMTALAPSRQALGVTAVSFLAVLLATLMAWVSVFLPSVPSPRFALQPLLEPNIVIGSLTGLALGLLALMGSLLGASLGIRYHQGLTRNNS